MEWALEVSAALRYLDFSGLHDCWQGTTSELNYVTPAKAGVQAKAVAEFKIKPLTKTKVFEYIES